MISTGYSAQIAREHIQLEGEMMGYSLSIGEAVIDWNEERVSIDCEIVRLDEAPAFGEITDYESQRWPSYTAWAKAMRELGLTDLMFDERNGGIGEFEWEGEWVYPLIQNHPGAAPITKAHVEVVAAKLKAYKEANPTHVAKYPPRGCEDDPTYDGYLCRGEWLLFWLKWAVENCEKPVFVNS